MPNPDPRPTPNVQPGPDGELPPLQSPLPHSDILDREEPEAGDEPDLPESSKPGAEPMSRRDADAVAGSGSVAGEEDPGAVIGESSTGGAPG